MHVALGVKGILRVCSSQANSQLNQAPFTRLHSHTFVTHSIKSRFTGALSSIVRARIPSESSGTVTTLVQHQHQLLKFHTSPSIMERTGDFRNKRKMSPVGALDRPTKQLKPEAAALIDGDETPSDAPIYVMDSEEDDGHMLALTAAVADTAAWQATIEKVVKNVVSIHFCQPCSFDTDAACSSEATGFVVDAVKGYILTNVRLCKRV